MHLPSFDHRLLLLASLFTIVGCDDHDTEISGEFEFRTSESGGTTKGNPDGGGWISNGLGDPDLSGVDPNHGLATDSGLSPDVGLLVDSNRYDTAKYLVECALEEGQSITKVVDGETLVFNGLVGLAPEWEGEACSQDCQEWVSACLLARTNVSGESVELWFKADHPAIGTESNHSYPIYEASFFGNLFADPDGKYICQGNMGSSTVAFLDGRTCSNDLTQPCGFTKYTDCETEPRCSFQGNGHPTAIDCAPSGGTEHHAISTYMPPPGHSNN